MTTYREELEAATRGSHQRPSGKQPMSAGEWIAIREKVREIILGTDMRPMCSWAHKIAIEAFNMIEAALRAQAPGEVVECPNCHNANKYGDYEGPTCEVCMGDGFTAAQPLDEAVTPSPVPSSGGLMEATAAQHIGRNGKPAQFTRNGILETCQCRECRTLSARPSSPKGGSRGCDDIAAERQRQISKEGWTPDHDDEHSDGAMASAALCYIDPELVLRHWPWDRKWWKPSDRRRDLVKAGALIAAEIDRLDRSSSPPLPKGGAETQPRAGGIGVDWWAESVKLYRQNQKLRKALKEHHDWHLSQGEQDFGDGIKLNMADEYADSGMCERTIAALDEAENQKLRKALKEQHDWHLTMINVERKDRC